MNVHHLDSFLSQAIRTELIGQRLKVQKLNDTKILLVLRRLKKVAFKSDTREFLNIAMLTHRLIKGLQVQET